MSGNVMAIALLLAALAIMVSAAALQLVMVIGVLEPALSLALAGYGALFVGMMTGLAGALRLRRPQR